MRAPCALYLVVVVVPRETVRFEDEEEFKNLKFFAYSQKKTTLKVLFHIFSSEKLTRLFLLMEVQPSPDRNKIDKTSNT